MRDTVTTIDEGTSASAESMARVALQRRRRAVPSRLLEWLRLAEQREPLAIFLVTRALFVLLTYFGVILFNNALHSPTHPSFIHHLLPAWNNRWDTAWYTAIAQRGYAWHKAARTSPSAFFPLYPLLIRIGVLVSHRSYIVVALAVSNLSFLAALGYLWRLTAWELDRDAASRAILYIAVFPTALFFFAGYTESLFLFLSVACFYHLRRQDWVLAGIFGGLASATRVTGVLLALPFLYEYARAANFSPRRMTGWGLSGVLLIPAGLAAFMVYLYYAVGDAWAFDHNQVAWQKIFTLKLWDGMAQSVRRILVEQPGASFFEVHNVINLGICLIFLAFTVLAARRLPPPYTIYLGAFWLVTLSTPALANGYEVPLISLSRYVLALFPIFIVMGMLGRNRRFHDAYLTMSTALLALFTLQFIQGGWII